MSDGTIRATKLDKSSAAAQFARGIADEGARLIADQVGSGGLQGFTLLIEACAAPLFTISPRGLAAYFRAHADLVDNRAGPKREKAYRDLERALQRISNDVAAYREAKGRRPS